ncbi:MAG: PD-(D/E)XK nuclease family protein [Caldilineaceae bacterium]
MIALSYSRLSTFEQCERKFSYLYVDKTVKDKDNEFTLYGTRVHEALENYGKAKADGTAVARDVLSDNRQFDEVRKHLPMVDAMLAKPGDKYFEHQMALREDRTPCDWFAPDIWLRGIADVLIVNGDTAFVVDWKTGKVKDNPTQLKLFACMVMEHFPAVQRVKTAFVWLGHNEVTSQTFGREHLQDMWNTLLPRMDAVQQAVTLGFFKSKPTGLCNWCPAKDVCPDRKKR